MRKAPLGREDEGRQKLEEMEIIERKHLGEFRQLAEMSIRKCLQNYLKSDKKQP